MTDAGKNAIWLRQLLADLQMEMENREPVQLFNDSNGAIELAKQQYRGFRLDKHFDTRAKRVREGRMQNSFGSTTYSQTSIQRIVLGKGCPGVELVDQELKSGSSPGVRIWKSREALGIRTRWREECLTPGVGRLISRE